MKQIHILKVTLVAWALIMTSTLSLAAADKDTIILASTTSTQNSGLFDHILPKFEEASGTKVNVVAVGTGAALKLARNGDADVLMVHHKKSEEQFVTDGYGVERFDLMHNDFVIIGPESDEANLSQMKSVTDALKAIVLSNKIFVSRGDDSGTHKREIELWQLANIAEDQKNTKWYREAGAGMGATLNVAIGMNAYTLTDRATWVSFKNKQSHKILFEGDPNLFNQYGIILVNPEKFPHIKAQAGQKFIDWMLSKQGQKAIASYKLEGQQLFTPDAISGDLSN
ncbi:substrate-binding domain-containing protein [Curvivirga aplysinae]|uniref:substrate-binding domain-containing protein n=1 Tax=Curvivirga aplysinae TaxID=2529852 RepID=UPI0012BD3AEA|nr:substrate-binding domain-containing protein [Curvivirga aplysinae]MTI10670.1 sulfate transporter [Curvivirga aplysinae]